MPDPEVERIARFLATHALLLLGAGMLAAVAAVVAILSAARLAGRFRPLVQRRITKLADGVQRIELVRGGAHLLGRGLVTHSTCVRLTHSSGRSRWPMLKG